LLSLTGYGESMTSDEPSTGGSGPPESLLEQLRRLGSSGARAANMLTAAAEQASSSGTLAGNLIAYATREALMSLLELAGPPSRDMTLAARRVVETADRVRAGRAAPETLYEAAERLDAALAGPGPHARRLESVITALARRAPARAEADLLDRYIEVLRAVGSALHSDVELQAARELLDRAIVTIGRLFGPMTTRLQEIDALIAVEHPGPGDVQALVGFTGDPRVLGYFYSNVSGPAWLLALSEHDLLQPPAEDVWMAYPYLAELAENEPDAVLAWLATRPVSQDLTASQAFALLSIVRRVGRGASEVVLRITRAHLEDPSVIHGVAGYVEALSEDEHGSSTVRELIKRALSAITSAGRQADDSYLAAGMLRVAISGAYQYEPMRWMKILTAKLVSILEPPIDFALRRVTSIAGLDLEAGAPMLELFAVSVRETGRASSQAGIATSERLAVLDKLPEPLRGRFIAAHLLETLDADADAALALLREEVATSRPMPETLALLRALRDREHPGLEEVMMTALGTPPSLAETDAYQQDQDLPESWVRAYGWLDGMPPSVQEAWAAANKQVEERWGLALPDGHIIPAPRAEWVQKTAAYNQDELNALAPIAAAEQIAAWRPSGESFREPSARGLAGTLSETIKAAPERWLAADPVAVVRALKHPIFIAAYLRALAEHAVALAPAPDGVVDAIELVQSEPWDVEVLSADAADYDESWLDAAHAAVQLIAALSDAGADLGADADRIWAIIARASTRRSEPQAFDTDADVKPIDHAINRPSMRSLEVGFSFAQNTAGDDGPAPAPILELVDEALRLGRPDGLHARAIIAPWLPWLTYHAPAWTEENWELLVGAEAPEDLGPATFDMYLERGRPYRAMLEAHRDLYAAALARVGEAARVHILTGMVWKADGYDPASVLGMLTAVDTAAVSQAAQWLAFSASHSEDMPLETVIDFLGVALDARLAPKAYEGYGWLAIVERLDADAWLELTDRAAQAAGGALEQPQQIAKRAAQHPRDVRAIRIVAALLGADLKLWYLRDVGEVGLQMLESEDTETNEAREQLRERLLEREFFDAKDDGTD
jgi:hypothetical protein